MEQTPKGLPPMRNPWDGNDVKDPRDPDLADPFAGELGDIAEPEAPKPAKRAPAKKAPAKKATPAKTPRKRA